MKPSPRMDVNTHAHTHKRTHIYTNTHTYTHMLVSNKLWKVKASKEEPVIAEKVLKTKPAIQC